MRSLCRRLLLGLGLVFVALTLPSVKAPPARADTILSLSPSSDTVSAGEVFTVSLSVSGAVNLYGWQVDITFDPTILSALSSSEGGFLSSGGSVPTFFIPGTMNSLTGLVDNMADSRTISITGVSGSGLLATLSFQALAHGTSALTLENVLLSNVLSQPLPVGGLSGASVGVAAAPEPGTLMLMLGGLAALGGWNMNARRGKR